MKMLVHICVSAEDGCENPMRMEVGLPSLPPCVTHAPRDLTPERAPAGGGDGSEQIGWAVIRPKVLSQLVPEGWRRLEGRREGRREHRPHRWFLSSPSLRRLSSSSPGPSCEGQKRLLKPGGAPAPLTRGQVWDGCSSCKPCTEGSPDGREGRVVALVCVSASDKILVRSPHAQLNHSPRSVY